MDTAVAYFYPPYRIFHAGRLSGPVARCHFALAEYRDESFPEAGFALPDHLARAVPKRRAEYLAGRFLARQLLAPLGFADFTGARRRSRAAVAAGHRRGAEP